ncbi:hypothetical protein SteCoe_567 [Stentor coeruleus]|uniref:Uncharacterized protein n=1 Tax=Stentor coeruleus TaxID=5963 RepID=A0A1R2D3K6_9CILI|nr:hypothetical protein SteCoe_567 [Stentor coeruleus]
MQKRDLERSMGSVSTLSSRRNITKISDPCEESLDSDSLLNCTLTSRKFQSLHRSGSDHILASMIEEKVSSLRSKFGELSGLRNKLMKPNPDMKQSSKYIGNSKPHTKTYERAMPSKTRTFIDRPIFSSEESRLTTIEYREKDSEIESSKFFNPNFEKLLFETEPKKSLIDSLVSQCTALKQEIETLNQKISITEKQLKDSERIRAYQDSIIQIKEREMKESDEKYKTVIEINKTLKLQINRLEKKLKTIDSKKDVNTTAIRNLSYIILSKDSSPLKETNLKTIEPNNNNGIMLKYLEVLNELHNSDQFILKIYEILRCNQSKEALKVLENIQDDVHERLQKTRKNVEELENIVYESKSPILPMRIESESTILHQKYDEDNDLMCFLKCQAVMVEELLMIS